MFALLLWSADRIRVGGVRWMPCYRRSLRVGQFPRRVDIGAERSRGWWCARGLIRRGRTGPIAPVRGGVCVGARYALQPLRHLRLDFLLKTVRSERADIIEWSSATQVPVIVLALWMVPTAITILSFCPQPLRREALIIIVLLAVGSFRVVRLLGFYALAVGFLAAPRQPRYPIGICMLAQ